MRWKPRSRRAGRKRRREREVRAGFVGEEEAPSHWLLAVRRGGGTTIVVLSPVNKGWVSPPVLPP